MHIEYKEKNQKGDLHSIILHKDIIKEDEGFQRLHKRRLWQRKRTYYMI
jgi:hypothetical protein